MLTKLALITVVYQNYDILKDFFESLNKQTNKDFHLYIVDLSTDRKKIAHPHFPYTIITGQNRGYAYGVNNGLQKAIRDGNIHFAVINSDVLIEETFVEYTLSSLNTYPMSLIGGKIYYAPGFEYHKDRYQLKDRGKILWYTGGTIDWQNVYVKHRGVDEVDTGQYSVDEPTDFITGCFMTFDKTTFDTVGLWDEKYFLYYEDADFCERAKRKGIKLYYDPSIVLWHKNAQSTGGSGSPLHNHYQKINRLRFGMKYAPFKTKLFLIRDYLLDKLKTNIS